MKNLQTYIQAMKLRTLIRSFFVSKGFLEVETPYLVRSPGMEPNLFPFESTMIEFNGTKHEAGLVTSPEYGCKKLLGAGLPKIFELARVFRNHEPLDETHNPEFTILEWYRAGEGYEEIMNDIEELVKYCARVILSEAKDHGTHDSSAEPQNDKTVPTRGLSPDVTWERVTVSELFKRHCDFALEDALDAPKLAAQCAKLDIQTQPTDSFDDLFFRLFLTKIEPHLGKECPTIVYEYPAQMAALARKKATDPRFAERFEVYINGMEIANAYGELTDPVEQRTRFEAEQNERKALGKHVFPIDEVLLASLGKIGQASGIALGVDRLAMLLTGASSIDEVIAFSAKELFRQE